MQSGLASSPYPLVPEMEAEEAWMQQLQKHEPRLFEYLREKGVNRWHVLAGLVAVLGAYALYQRGGDNEKAGKKGRRKRPRRKDIHNVHERRKSKSREPDMKGTSMFDREELFTAHNAAACPVHCRQLLVGSEGDEYRRALGGAETADNDEEDLVLKPPRPTLGASIPSTPQKPTLFHHSSSPPPPSPLPQHEEQIPEETWQTLAETWQVLPSEAMMLESHSPNDHPDTLARIVTEQKISALIVPVKDATRGRMKNSTVFYGLLNTYAKDRPQSPPPQLQNPHRPKAVRRSGERSQPSTP